MAGDGLVMGPARRRMLLNAWEGWKMHVNCYLHRWTDINREQHPDYVDFVVREPRADGTNPWTSEPMLLTLPGDSWVVSENKAGGMSLFDPKGKGHEVTMLGGERRSVQLDNGVWLSMVAAGE